MTNLHREIGNNKTQTLITFELALERRSDSCHFSEDVL